MATRPKVLFLQRDRRPPLTRPPRGRTDSRSARKHGLGKVLNGPRPSYPTIFRGGFQTVTFPKTRGERGDPEVQTVQTGTSAVGWGARKSTPRRRRQPEKGEFAPEASAERSSGRSQSQEGTQLPSPPWVLFFPPPWRPCTVSPAAQGAPGWKLGGPVPAAGLTSEEFISLLFTRSTIGLKTFPHSPRQC